MSVLVGFCRSSFGWKSRRLKFNLGWTRDAIVAVGRDEGARGEARAAKRRAA
jgi:hypothetical protein